MRILVNCRNNKRLLGRLKAFDRHFNMVLEEVRRCRLNNARGERKLNWSKRIDSFKRCS